MSDFLSVSLAFLEHLDDSPELFSIPRSPTYTLLPSHWPFCSLLNQYKDALGRDPSLQCTKCLIHNS